MASAVYSYSVTVGGISASYSVVYSQDGLVNNDPITVPLALALSSWVKTDADTAAGNLAGGHGLSTGVFDVYWDGGQRYGVDVTITTNACALDGGSGTDFPDSANLTVRLAPRQQVNISLDGDEAEFAFFRLAYLASAAGQRGHMAFEDADDDSIASIAILASYPGDPAVDASLIYNIAAGQSNPFTGDVITKLFVSQSSTTESPILSAAALYDSTP